MLDNIYRKLFLIKSVFSNNISTKGNFSTYVEALKNIKGYEDDNLLDYIYTKTVAYSKSLAKGSINNPSKDFLLLINAVNSLINLNRKIIVLDFGGGAGKHFFETKNFFINDNIHFSWNIIETKTMCEKCKSIENEELRFYSNLKDFVTVKNQVDLIFSDCAIPFLSEPYDLLCDLVNLKAKTVLLSRLQATSNKDIIAVQKSRLSLNGPFVKNFENQKGIAEYPITILNLEKIIDLISKNYYIKIHSVNPASYVCNNKLFDVHSFYAVLK